MGAIWIRKYLPSALSDVHGHEEPIRRLRNLIEGYRKGKKPIFLYGGTGNGKTASVYAAANELGLELIEVNASDIRNADAINSLLGGAIKQASLFGSGKLILIDEIEGISGSQDRGGLQAITRLIPGSTYPIVIIGSDPFDQKFKELRKMSELIEFKPLEYNVVLEVVKKIAKKEGIEYEEEALKHLARVSNGDVRAAINDLQTISAGIRKVTGESVKDLGVRQVTQSMQESLKRIFKTTNPEIALGAFDEVDEDIDKIFLWVEENIPEEYLKPEHLKNAFDNISLADIFFGRIRRWQYYRFYVYCYNLLTVGIALSKDQKYPSVHEYKPTSRLLKIWIYNNANAKKKAISEKVAEKTHTSMKRAMREYIPYLRYVFKKNRKESEILSEYFDLDGEERDWLAAK